MEIQKWKYLRLQVDLQDKVQKHAGYKGQSIKVVMEELGERGWELVSECPSPDTSSHRTIMTFKLPA